VAVAAAEEVEEGAAVPDRALEKALDLLKAEAKTAA
jgi:hypothetical protein